MARPIAKDHDQKRAAILKTAARVFADEGFDRASMAGLAKACGISKSLIYHYYPSKEALLYDILHTHLSALKGAVVGGGLELASAAHIRVIDPGTYFALPEGQRGIFTGGGATIRVSDMIGKYRMIDMILTGRVYQGQEAVDLGLAQYITEDGGSMAKAMELADQIAQNLPLTNFAICSAISHLNNMSGMDAAYAEAVVGGVVNTQPAARERLEAFANKTAARVRPNS